MKRNLVRVFSAFVLCEELKRTLFENGEDHEGRQGVHPPRGTVLGQEGHHRQEQRRRHDRPSVRARPRRGHRKVPAQGHEAHVQEEDRHQVEAQAVPQGKTIKLQRDSIHAFVLLKNLEWY